MFSKGHAMACCEGGGVKSQMFQQNVALFCAFCFTCLIPRWQPELLAIQNCKYFSVYFKTLHILKISFMQKCKTLCRVKAVSMYSTVKSREP